MEPETEDEKVVYIGERRKKKADPKDAVNVAPMILVVILSAVIIITVMFMAYRIHKADLAKIDFLDKRGILAAEMLDRIHTANALRGRLAMQNLKISRADNSVTIAGDIVYAGKPPVSDIFIEVYFLDGREQIISHETYRSLRGEGPSLSTNETRGFHFTMPFPAEDVKDVRPVITGISFDE